LAQEPPDAKKMALFGFEAEDFEATDIVDYWPEHKLAVQVFLGMQTQWRVGMAGLVGLDYNALGNVYQALRITDEQVPDVFSQLQVIEFKFLELKRPAE